MAFGGVETGRTNARLAPSVAPSAGGTGETPAAVATAIATGTTMLAAAVFDVVSVMRMAKAVATAVMPHRLGSPLAPSSPCASRSASPVEYISVPRLKPPPKSRMVPQSILTASAQPSAPRGGVHATGRRNSSEAASTAATPSSRRSPTARASGSFAPRASASAPGVTHKTTAVRNAARV